MANRTGEEIGQLVREASVATSGTRSRMIEDQDTFDLIGHKRLEADRGKRVFTGNWPRVYGVRVITALTGARMIIRSPFVGNNEEERTRGRKVELFFRGMLRDSDQMLRRMVEPNFRAQMSFYTALRGFTAGIHVLRRNAGGRLQADMKPWDPANVVWNVDDDGLAWICNTHFRTSSQLTSTYPGISISGTVPTHVGREGETLYEFYEFYDRSDSYRVIGNRIISKTPHGLEDRVPASIIPVGPQPMLTLGAKQADPARDFGQSMFNANREMIWQANEFLSLAYDLVDLSTDPGLILSSVTGAKDLTGFQNPNRKGNISQVVMGEEEIVPVQPLQMTADFGAILQTVMNALNRGMLPPLAYGEGEYPSGYAIKQLRKTTGDVLNPYIDAQVAWLMEAEDCMRTQFTRATPTGSYFFEPAKVQGVLPSRTLFADHISPEELLDAFEPMIGLVPDLPTDDAAEINKAQMLRQPGPTGRPLASDDYIQDDTLMFDDPDLVREQIDLQQARSATPRAQMLQMYDAMIARGEDALAEEYDLERMKLVLQDMLELMQLQAAAAQGQATGGGPGGGPEGGKGGGPTGQGGGASEDRQGRPQRPRLGGDPRNGLAPAGQGFDPPEPDERNRRGGRRPGSQERQPVEV